MLTIERTAYMHVMQPALREQLRETIDEQGLVIVPRVMTGKVIVMAEWIAKRAHFARVAQLTEVQHV